MSKTVSQFIKNLDAFGQPVTVKYNGESSFNTHIGGICTCLIQTFMFAFTLNQVVNLVTYQDPQITQFIGYDTRGESSGEINLGESKGELAFSIYEVAT